MKRACTSIALLLAAAGCYGPETYQEDSALARCGLYEECGFLSSLGVEDHDACLELLRSDAYACVDYDAAAAEQCITELDELTCEEYSSGYFPMACVDACVVTDE